MPDSAQHPMQRLEHISAFVAGPSHEQAEQRGPDAPLSVHALPAPALLAAIVLKSKVLHRHLGGGSGADMNDDGMKAV